LTREEKQELFFDALRHRSDPVGTVVAVGRLPAKVRDQKIEIYLRRIEGANKMLETLVPKKGG